MIVMGGINIALYPRPIDPVENLSFDEAKRIQDRLAKELAKNSSEKDAEQAPPDALVRNLE